jgi:hypothetical protein
VGSRCEVDAEPGDALADHLSAGVEGGPVFHTVPFTTVRPPRAADSDSIRKYCGQSTTSGCRDWLAATLGVRPTSTAASTTAATCMVSGGRS